ncbi:relaxase/mobilization nuclease domain-containing protein [Afifella marina]|uniref:Relaxase/Mobilisation nuclease domain-containing protein n=1 Tax=Afifella marina DSM 2698 TaxID=1120955 RepID=A0A1G5NBK9_AFIMA|nr:relaxase/mobilization nuclease domain-containing protein [Afifella marina]MBK1623088.1 relaxase [Afifella marina DSM 2698]MBK1626082.1 relaxase [Afifella marina]MBK5916960.1 relaxase [Afifella marina]RAI21963.1 relaxase [Afifella marina DSM 2698]SCZ34000.1 Relaxase/Mobilisation nuclease domain-containing protein [Afifella marina DSM 2698]
MILKGSQRGGAKQLSLHLMNDRDNDHVTVQELRGFIARDLHGALAESHAISKGTKCVQFMFSLSLNPPKEVVAGEDDFRRAADEAEKRLGLEGQPRAIVLHEKEGRRHAHVVWSRINPETMTAINLPHFKRKLNDLARELYLEHDWTLPEGLRRDGGKSPLNFTLAEWQQAKRLKLDPREIKQSFQDAWQRSDDAKSFAAALRERGYFLARGDRRGFVALDVHGEVFAVARWAGVRTKEVRERLGDENALRPLPEVRDRTKTLVSDKLQEFIDDVDQRHIEEFHPLAEERTRMVRAHRVERQSLRDRQKLRWQDEQKERSNRFATGLRGLWGRLTGTTAAVRKQNEAERWQCVIRDRDQRDGLIMTQMNERRNLQKRIDSLRRRHAQNRRILAREITQALHRIEQEQDRSARDQTRRRDRSLSPPR